MAIAAPERSVISKPASVRAAANMPDYERECARFTWADARAQLDGLPGGVLNIAHEALDRHALGPRAGHVAIRWLGKDGERRELTYADLYELSARFAGVLRDLGIGRGDRVFALSPRLPELYAAALGTLRHGAVFSPLFSAFGPEPLRQRLALGAGRVLVTTPALYAKKVAGMRDRLEALEHVLLIGPPEEPAPGTQDLLALLAHTEPAPVPAATRPEDPALLHFTSGTTGTPKGAVHVHEAVVAHRATGLLALDLHPGDVFWCTADPGWVTGTSYGIVAPLVCGVTSVVTEAEFEPKRWYRTLASERVTVWYTAPTAVRMLMRTGADLPHDYDLSALRFVASVGEPLNPEAVLWGERALGLPIHDNWWQTETGGIMVANFASADIRPGSMGRPLPGVTAAVAERDADGELVLDGDGAPVLVDDPAREGELLLRTPWPSMFRAYLHEPERYARCFAGGWYRTGDLVRRDADGYLWFVGRGDDVIKSAGHLIGPFEVESALMEHPAVAEAGVIGIPDPLIGARIKAFVVLHAGHAPDAALQRELLGFARKRLGPAVAPKEIAFTDEVPRTRSGKIMRRLLRARELGLPEGDLSTLESAR